MNESKKRAKVKNAKLLSQPLIAVGIAFLNKIVPVGEIAVVSKSSKQITINFPPELIDVFAKHLKSKHFRDFVREAFAEKLCRDFGEKNRQNRTQTTNDGNAPRTSRERRFAVEKKLRENALLIFRFRLGLLFFGDQERERIQRQAKRLKNKLQVFHFLRIVGRCVHVKSVWDNFLNRCALARKSVA